MNRRSTFVVLTIALMACAACTSSRGAPRSNSEIVPPSEMLEFSLLYGQNCAGCHGAEGKGGASFALADPVYLAIADDTVIRRTTSQGVHGTAMPAFAQSAGGMLTDKQIESLVQGIRSWAKPDSVSWYDSAPLCCAVDGRSTTWRQCLSDLLLLLSRSGWPRRKGKFDCGWFVPRSS